MNDGGQFRAAPTGERMLAKRGRPLSTRIAFIVGVALFIATASTIAFAYPSVRGSSTELTRLALSNQADSLARFLDSPGPLDAANASIPEQILEILRDHHVTAVLVSPVAEVTAPMESSDRSPVLHHKSISDVRLDANGTAVFYEFRGLDGGYSLYLTEPESVADVPTRLLLIKMGYGSLLVLMLAMAVVVFYTRRETRPIRDAVIAAERMADGSRNVRLVEGGVAEIADLSRSMNELSDALANSEDRQRQFLLSVSHELRTPLTAIAGYAEALADGVIGGDDVEATGAVMLDESLRLQRLVHDLLDLSRAGAVELRLDPQDVDLRELVVGAGQVWRDRCDREQLEFSLELPESPARITTDAVRVRQIIDNLCENALRVTPAGQPLVLALHEVPGGVELQVRDGGPGLSQDDMSVAFEPSALHDRYIGIRPVGTGVGLALVGRLAQRLGGRAQAGSAPEGGASFTVYLPREWGRAPASGAPVINV